MLHVYARILAISLCVLLLAVMGLLAAWRSLG
jgi:hypothetical protein